MPSFVKDIKCLTNIDLKYLPSFVNTRYMCAYVLATHTHTHTHIHTHTPHKRTHAHTHTHTHAHTHTTQTHTHTHTRAHTYTHTHTHTHLHYSCLDMPPPAAASVHCGRAYTQPLSDGSPEVRWNGDAHVTWIAWGGGGGEQTANSYLQC